MESLCQRVNAIKATLWQYMIVHVPLLRVVISTLFFQLLILSGYQMSAIWKSPYTQSSQRNDGPLLFMDFLFVPCPFCKEAHFETFANIRSRHQNKNYLTLNWCRHTSEKTHKGHLSKRRFKLMHMSLCAIHIYTWIKEYNFLIKHQQNNPYKHKLV